VARGETVFGTYCGRCHGRAGAVNHGILPDLRYSATLASSEVWQAIVLDGRLARNGMAGFASVLSRNDAEAVRAYVIAQAHATGSSQPAK
jgi:mono/diheme cytochrome c family protein